MWHHHTQGNPKMLVVNLIIVVQKMPQSIWSIVLTGSNCLRVETFHLTTSTLSLPLQHGFSPKRILLALVPWLRTEKVYQKVSRKWKRRKYFRQNSIGTVQMISSSIPMFSVHQRRERRTWCSLPPTGPFLGITTDDGKSDAMLYELYDFTKVVSEITDQRIGFYPRKVKSWNWLMVAFAYILDKVRVNASTLFALNNKK